LVDFVDDEDGLGMVGQRRCNLQHPQPANTFAFALSVLVSVRYGVCGLGDGAPR
jgi:hypothetical protein